MHPTLAALPFRWRAVPGLAPPDASLRIATGIEKVQRYVLFVTYHPTVVWFGRYVEQAAGFQLDHTPILECRR